MVVEVRVGISIFHHHCLARLSSTFNHILLILINQ